FAGPKYDEQGEVIPHSLLGTYEDFHREATRRGDILADLPSPREEHGRSDTPTVKYEKVKRQQKAKLSRDDNNALANWQHRMMERKRQQGYISKSSRRSGHEPGRQLPPGAGTAVPGRSRHPRRGLWQRM
ncbi:mycbp-associated protein-like isoform x4, partial [Plakobranchus ocellatus]